MGNKIKFMSGVDVPNIDVSNTTTTKILNAQDAIINVARIETAKITDLEVKYEATIDTMRNTQDGVSLGGAVVGANIAIGNGANGKGTGSIAIGNNAVASVENSIQIGVGTNSTANSLQIGDNNIYDIENNEIHLDKPEHVSEPIEARIEGTTGGGSEDDPGRYTWYWKTTAYIGKNLDITILSSSITPRGGNINARVSDGEYDRNTGYITFECRAGAQQETDQGFDYTIDYTYEKIIPASNTNITAGNIQTQNISFLSSYDSETKEQQDLDTVLQKLNTMKKYSFTSLEDVWNFLTKNNGVHGIYMTHSSEHSSTEYIYISGILFYAEKVDMGTETADVYTLKGIGYTSEYRVLLLSIDIRKYSNRYAVYGYTQASGPYLISGVQRIEIN